jgi:hypothetical protein
MRGDWARSPVGFPEGLAIKAMQPVRLVADERVGLLVSSQLPDGLVDGKKTRANHKVPAIGVTRRR